MQNIEFTIKVAEDETSIHLSSVPGIINFFLQTQALLKHSMFGSTPIIIEQSSWVWQ